MAIKYVGSFYTHITHGFATLEYMRKEDYVFLHEILCLIISLVLHIAFSFKFAVSCPNLFAILNVSTPDKSQQLGITLKHMLNIAL